MIDAGSARGFAALFAICVAMAHGPSDSATQELRSYREVRMQPLAELTSEMLPGDPLRFFLRPGDEFWGALADIDFDAVPELFVVRSSGDCLWNQCWSWVFRRTGAGWIEDRRSYPSPGVPPGGRVFLRDEVNHRGVRTFVSLSEVRERRRPDERVRFIPRSEFPAELWNAFRAAVLTSARDMLDIGPGYIGFADLNGDGDATNEAFAGAYCTSGNCFVLPFVRIGDRWREAVEITRDGGVEPDADGLPMIHVRHEYAFGYRTYYSNGPMRPVVPFD